MDFFEATAIDIRFLVEEDRMHFTLRTPEQAIDLLMTRRLTRMMLGGIVELLMRSNVDIANAAATHRNDVLLFEHMSAATAWERQSAAAGAVAGTPDTVPEPGPAAPSAMAGSPRLITKIDLTVKGGGLNFVFHDADGPRSTIDLVRDKAHHLLSFLLERSVEAQWDLQELYWLHRRTHIVVPDRPHLC
ncbi:hypothetical protein [Niveispirillum fermenti]|uniref:hypothetical protein n=1 Tax=Niveispirillum fermenti TaxID=1233113 RepID=UPI003A885100